MLKCSSNINEEWRESEHRTRGLDGAPKLAKLSVPRMSRILPRPRLFVRLDISRTRRVVWILGPPGGGKTALVASWLAQRKLRHPLGAAG